LVGLLNLEFKLLVSSVLFTKKDTLGKTLLARKMLYLKTVFNIGIKVELIDNEMPKLYESSERTERKQKSGANNVNSIPGVVKQAIAMARFIQDPLLCYSQLCNLDRDVLSLKLHPMQQQIITLSGSRNSEDATELLRMLEIEFINAVNDVGVDLNRCNHSPHTSNCLQYVCGLGPRKAQHILKVLRQQRTNNMNAMSANKQQKHYPVAFNRLFLVTKCSLGRRVLINCAGFIKFDVNKIESEKEKEDDEEEEDIELLDSTRIHPETYEWARKMAIDALDFDDNNDLNSANSASALREIFENPKRLKDLDLDAFAAELLRTNHGNKSITLYDIRNELSKQYKDKRIQYQSMNEEERFYCLTKESPATFYVGKLVMCRVVGIARRRPNKEQLDEANPIKVIKIFD
jgi:transcription elongation factor SPT6